jgi:hypothetical protein
MIPMIMTDLLICTDRRVPSSFLRSSYRTSVAVVNMVNESGCVLERIERLTIAGDCVEPVRTPLVQHPALVGQSNIPLAVKPLELMTDLTCFHDNLQGSQTLNKTYNQQQDDTDKQQQNCVSDDKKKTSVHDDRPPLLR